MLEALLDRIPPQNLEAEQCVLGSMMIEEPARFKGLEILKAQDFYRPGHQVIFDALSVISANNEPVDLITTQETLRSRGKLDDVGGTEYLMALVDSVPTAANIEYYAKIVECKSLLRKLIAAGTEIIGLANNEVDDVDEVLSRAREVMLRVERKDKGNTRPVSAVINEVWERLEELERGEKRIGISIGVPAVDRICYGIEAEPQLTLIGGRPSNGKTVMLNWIAMNAAKEGKRVLYFSLETSMKQLVTRMAFMLSGVDSHQFRSGNWECEEQRITAWNRLAESTSELYGFRDKILLRDIRPGNVSELVAQAKQEMLKNKIDVILIDYLQLLSGGRRFSTRNEEMQHVCQSIKGISQNESIPVVAAAQLNRASGNREDKRPSLTDLREGGNMEAEADKVIFPHNPPPIEKGKPGEYRSCSIIVAKHKDGPTGSVDCYFQPGCMKFAQYVSDFEK